MSNSTIANCKRCNKLFKKTISDSCPPCAETENQQYQQMFRMLQNSKSQGGILIDDLSAKVGMPIEIIEEYYFEAKLGTAGLFLKFKCRSCSEVIGEENRKGRYCLSCSNELSDKAGVQVRSRQSIEKAEAEAKEIIQLPSDKQKQEQAARPRPSRRAGFTRNR